MGAQNVKAVYEHWPDLPNSAFRLLAYMALVSKDADTPPKFWGGRRDLAAALGRQLPPEEDDSPAAVAQRRAAFKAARDATTLLSKRGAIRLAKAARGGSRQTWALNVRRGQAHENRAPAQADEETSEPEEEHEERAPEVHENRAHRRTENVQEAHENRAPIEKETEGTTQEERRISRRARDRQGTRWLHQRYGLTDEEAAAVIETVRGRAGKPVGNLVSYMESMTIHPDGSPKTDLLDIVEAVQVHSTPTAPDDDPYDDPTPTGPVLPDSRSVAEALAAATPDHQPAPDDEAEDEDGEHVGPGTAAAKAIADAKKHLAKIAADSEAARLALRTRGTAPSPKATRPSPEGPDLHAAQPDTEGATRA
ncbi:hypothetical protein [Actinomadura litoris]|uniref:hypothetical protein n=1 Tax=Actinomadura litoris TaxID=2678616 RepID=UPI001FA7CCB2|nr:hypothetical protein [Actinomadura litoris]